MIYIYIYTYYLYSIYSHYKYIYTIYTLILVHIQAKIGLYNMTSAWYQATILISFYLGMP